MKLTFFVFFLLIPFAPFTTSRLVSSMVAENSADVEPATLLLLILLVTASGARDAGWKAATAVIASRGRAAESFIVVYFF
jgi:hypothetical protein